MQTGTSQAPRTDSPHAAPEMPDTANKMALHWPLTEGRPSLDGPAGRPSDGTMVPKASVTPTATPPQELALLAGLRAGDEAAFEELVRTHGPRMLAVAQRYVRPGPDAEDVLQDAFVNVSRAIGSFEGGSRLSTWLHRIVVNCALMRLRSRSRRPENLLPPDTVATQADANRPTPWAVSAADIVDRADLRESVQRALERLPEMDRAIVRLRDIQGMTLDEVSRLLDVGLTTVKEHLHRARHALRELLEPVLQEARR